MYILALAGWKQEFVPRGRTKSKRQNTPRLNTHLNKTQPIELTHIGAGDERSIKKSNSEHRQNLTGIHKSNSCSSSWGSSAALRSTWMRIGHLCRTYMPPVLKLEEPLGSAKLSSTLTLTLVSTATRSLKGDTSRAIAPNSRHCKMWKFLVALIYLRWLSRVLFPPLLLPHNVYLFQSTPVPYIYIRVYSCIQGLNG